MKKTDIAKELRGTETRRKIYFSSETVNQVTTRVKFYGCYYLPFSVSFVNLCFAFYMVGFYKFFHLHLILHSKLLGTLVTVKFSSHKNRAMLQSKTAGHCKQYLPYLPGFVFPMSLSALFMSTASVTYW